MKTQDFGSQLVQLLEDRSVGLLLIALIADVVAADARFNHWMAYEGKQTLDSDAILEAIDVYEGTIGKCQTEIERFAATRDSTSLEMVLTEALQTLKR